MTNRTHLKNNLCAELASAKLKHEYGTFEVNNRTRNLYKYWLVRWRRQTIRDLLVYARKLKPEYKVSSIDWSLYR